MKYQFGIDEVKGNCVKSTRDICKSPSGIVDLNVSLSISRKIHIIHLFLNLRLVIFFSFVELVSPSFGSNEGILLTTRDSRFEELYQDRLSDGALNISSINECWFEDEIFITAEFTCHERLTCLSTKLESFKHVTTNFSSKSNYIKLSSLLLMHHKLMIYTYIFSYYHYSFTFSSQLKKLKI